MTVLPIQTAEVFEPLLAPARYKGARGGRGSGKSHFFAQMLVETALCRPGLRAVCIREVQKSLAQSVKALVEDKIEEMGVGGYFGVQESLIRAPGDGLLIFQGMQNHTADSIKSLEGYQIAYCEEAQSLSQRSLDLLRPTIRAPGSELWFAWNPRHETDPVDAFFRGGSPPPDSVCVEANWRDNPWFPDVLRAEKDHDFAADPEKAAHVWGGGYELIGEAAYLARWVALAETEGRVGDFPHDADQPVKTAWDIGVDDYTAIWFFQEHWRDGRPRVRVVDYYETSGDGAELIVETAIHSKPYRYAGHHLPHDVMTREWGAGARSRFATLSALGLKPILPGVNLGAGAAEERVAASRALLPLCEFHDSPAVKLGLRRLRNYRRKWNETLGQYVGPLKDGNDHGADAFGEYAVNSPMRPKPKAPPTETRTGYAPRYASIERADHGRL